MKWIRKILGLCDHKWKQVKINEIYEHKADRPYATQYILQCEGCGNMKKKTF